MNGIATIRLVLVFGLAVYLASVESATGHKDSGEPSHGLSRSVYSPGIFRCCKDREDSSRFIRPRSYKAFRPFYGMKERRGLIRHSALTSRKRSIIEFTASFVRCLLNVVVQDEEHFKTLDCCDYLPFPFWCS